MKKSLLAVVAALAIAGCSQNDLVDEIDNGGKTPISFNSNVRKGARATATTSATFTNFTVKAYSSSETYNGAAADFFFTDNISYTTSWGGTQTIYWPEEGKVHFFAYSPEDAATYAPASGNLTGYPTLQHTVATDTQIDLLAANVIDKTKTNSAIGLGFKHLLTQINFSIKLPIKGLTYTISTIKLKNVNSAGVFTYNGNENTVGTWGTLGTPTEFSYTPNATVFTPTADNKVEKLCGATANANSLMLLPQSGTRTLEIVYSVKQGNTTLLTATKTAEITAEWESGQNLLYQISLPLTGLEEIKLTGTVNDDWNAIPESGTDTPVIP